MEKIELTRAEISALEAHEKILRTNYALEIFRSIEELLEASYKVEDMKANLCKDGVERGNHLYGRGLSERLLIDIKHVKRRFIDDHT